MPPPVDESKILLKEAYFLQMLHFSQYTKNGEIVQKQIFEWMVAKVKVKIRINSIEQGDFSNFILQF